MSAEGTRPANSPDDEHTTPTQAADPDDETLNDSDGTPKENPSG